MDINEKLVHCLLDTNHMMRMLYEGKASQSRILIILYEQKGMTQKHLTEFLGIQPGSASEILTKLENTKLIRRSPSKKDRRVMEISLTDEGIKHAKTAIERRYKRHKQMFLSLTEDEKELLLMLLEKIDDDWEERFSLTKNHSGQNKKHLENKR